MFSIAHPPVMHVVGTMIAGGTWTLKWSLLDELFFELKDHCRREFLRLPVRRRREWRGAERHRGHFLIEYHRAAAASYTGRDHLSARIDCERDRPFSGDHLVARGVRISLVA